LDEAGTPFCFTVDFDGLEDQTVTVRNRDTMTQERIGIDKCELYVRDKMKNWSPN
jgi:glycyl-tRNA synthetase